MALRYWLAAGFATVALGWTLVLGRAERPALVETCISRWPEAVAGTGSGVFPGAACWLPDGRGGRVGSSGPMGCTVYFDGPEAPPGTDVTIEVLKCPECGAKSPRRVCACGWYP